MRQLFVIAICCLFASCNNSSSNGNVAKNVDNVPFNGTTEFTYKGHQYIKFTEFNVGGVVHDPECPCNKNIKTMEK